MSCKYHPGRIQVALVLIAMVGLNSRMAGRPGGDEPVNTVRCNIRAWWAYG